MGRKKKIQPLESTTVSEELKITVALYLRNFKMNEKSKELEFPSSLTAEERKYIHLVSQQYGMQSKSRGSGSNRCLTVYKGVSNIIKKESELKFSDSSFSLLCGILQRHPLSNKERHDLTLKSEKDRFANQELREMNMSRSLGRLVYGPPQIPPNPGKCEATFEARKLPVWNMRDQLLKVIDSNQVVLVRGETGSGKTTQVPQIILEEFHSRKHRCRVLCTQPRRISALSIAERVSIERVEKIGSTVGYQIRLEGRVSPKTILTFCTTGILLRTLMGSESALNNVTHVLVDEVHERDRFTDFLLTVLKEALPKFRHLKVILMSANLDAALYAKYFNNCPIVDVPGRTYPVKSYYLEDVLKYVDYSTPQYKKLYDQLKQKDKVDEALQWAENVLRNLRATPLEKPDEDKESTKSSGPDVVVLSENSVKSVSEHSGKAEGNFSGRDDVDECIQQAFSEGEDEYLMKMVDLVVSGSVSPDYQHSTTLASPLMVASVRGRMEIVEQLLTLGASVNLKAANHWTAVDWARSVGHNDIVECLESYSACEGIDLEGSSKNEQNNLESKVIIPETSPEDKILVEAYSMSTTNISSSDTDLIYILCFKIHSSEPPGGILIFLPGYDDIVALRDRIVADEAKFVSRGGRYMLYCLHSHMQSSDQKRVFHRTPPGTRKIVLSTNIAETSVTINDIVYVIDCGKVKEMSFDSLSAISCLRPVWVSQASAMQRKGRAGRCQPGIAYHLISKSNFNLLQSHQTPEILRSPLQDLCLHTKLLTTPNMQIVDFLSRAPEPPAALAVKNAVQILKSMDALDSWEEVTELGHHLLDLNLPPHLGKMVITATVLKCLDPILTIATCLAFRDPFTLPTHPSDKMKAKRVKQKFADTSFSDHVVFLKAYQSWEKVSSQHWQQRNWCDRHFISSATMEMVQGMRGQILSQLRNAGFVRQNGHGDLKDLNSNSDNWAVVKAALLSGIYPNLIRVDRQTKQMKTAKDGKVRLHSSSVLLDANEKQSKEAKCRSLNAAQKVLVTSMPSEWLIYDEMIRIGCNSYVKNVTVVSAFSVLLLAGPSRLPSDALSDPACGGRMKVNKDGVAVMVNSDSEAEESTQGTSTMLRIDPWIQFRGKPQHLNAALLMRQKLQALIIRRLRTPHKPTTLNDEEVINSIVAVLTEEERQLGIGQRVDSNHYSSSNSSSDFCNFSDLSLEASSQGRRGVGSQCTPSGPHLVSSNSYPSFSSATASPSSIHSPYVSNGYSEQANNGQNGLHQRRGLSGSSLDSPGFISGASDSQHYFNSTTSIYTNGLSPTSNIVQNHSAANVRSGHSFIGNAGSSKRRFFIITVGNLRQVEISQARGLWAFSFNIEKKIVQAAQNGCVILVFALGRNNQYNGFAKFFGQKANEICPELTNVGPPTGSLYRIEWIKKICLHFQQARHLTNPYADNVQLYLSQNGQEIEASVGEQLISLWDSDSQQHGGRPGVNDQPNLHLPHSPQPHLLPYHSQPALPSHASLLANPAFHHPGTIPPSSQYAPRPFIGYGLNFGPDPVFRGDSRR